MMIILQYTADPWATQGLGHPTTHEVENPHITGQPSTYADGQLWMKNIVYIETNIILSVNCNWKKIFLKTWVWPKKI